MARAMAKVSVTEKDSFKQGKSGAKVKQNKGPVRGVLGTKPAGGGITKPTRGKLVS